MVLPVPEIPQPEVPQYEGTILELRAILTERQRRLHQVDETQFFEYADDTTESENARYAGALRYQHREMAKFLSAWIVTVSQTEGILLETSTDLTRMTEDEIEGLKILLQYLQTETPAIQTVLDLLTQNVEKYLNERQGKTQT